MEKTRRDLLAGSPARNCLCGACAWASPLPHTFSRRVSQSHQPALSTFRTLASRTWYLSQVAPVLGAPAIIGASTILSLSKPLSVEMFTYWGCSLKKASLINIERQNCTFCCRNFTILWKIYTFRWKILLLCGEHGKTNILQVEKITKKQVWHVPDFSDSATTATGIYVSS